VYALMLLPKMSTTSKTGCVQRDKSSHIYSNDQLGVDVVGQKKESVEVAISEPLSNAPPYAKYLTADDPWILQIRVRSHACFSRMHQQILS
jgi:hypothetical protein